ncbi:MAG TPA: isoprenylcysteine carboxylmethyltransferase family protein [Pyrinomonadaceae bacterium]
MTFFDYFQIAIIATTVTVIAGKAIYLRITTGINPIVVGRGSEGGWRIAEMFGLAGLMLWMTEVVLHATHSRFDLFPQIIEAALLHTQSVKSAGAALAAVGLIIFLLAFFSFGDSWRIGIDRKRPSTLVTGGIFSITRNPIYVAFDLIFVGIFLMNGTWFFLVTAVLAPLVVHSQIVREEKFLVQRYGEAYERYRKKVPRYLIW